MTVAVDAVVYYRIFDPMMSVVNIENAAKSTHLLSQTTLRNFLGKKTLSEILTGRDEITHIMQVTGQVGECLKHGEVLNLNSIICIHSLAVYCYVVSSCRFLNTGWHVFHIQN